MVYLCYFHDYFLISILPAPLAPPSPLIYLFLKSSLSTHLQTSRDVKGNEKEFSKCKAVKGRVAKALNEVEMVDRGHGKGRGSECLLHSSLQ